MPNQGIWITDPDSGEDRFIYYHELEQEVVQSFIKPIGGFIFPANLFVLSKLPKVPFYVMAWLPKRGKSLIYAPPKSGKSYLFGLQLARCIGSGELFLGIPTTQGTVLYIQFELGEELLQYRMREETKKDYENVYVGTTFSMKLDTGKVVEKKRDDGSTFYEVSGGQGQLWKALEAVEPNVLILDPKIKMISGDENESSDMTVITDFLDVVIERFNCSILIIDHSGKDLSKKSRGSSIWEGWVDSYLQMKKVSKKEEQLRVKIQPISLRHAQLPPNPIEAELGEDFEFHLVGVAQTVKQQVLGFIKKAKDYVMPAQLFEQGIGSNTSVYKALKELVNEKKVAKTQWGHYSWTGGKE